MKFEGRKISFPVPLSTSNLIFLLSDIYNRMGNKVSKPARKLAGSATGLKPLSPVSRERVQLPSAELKARQEHGFVPTEEVPKHNGDAPVPTEINGTSREFAREKIPEGKDGMDPQADQKYIDLITNLGRQIHSKNVRNDGPQANVIALKQLLNRKRLHAAGQSEAQAHKDSVGGDRTVINPKTLTAIIDAMNDPRGKNEDVLKDFQLQKDFLSGLERFKVAHNVVMIEEHAGEDQIGPIKGRRQTKQKEHDVDQTEENSERVKELKKRLE